MRGSDEQNGSLFSYVNLEERIPARYPLRKIKAVVDPALASVDAGFTVLYANEGCPSIAPEWLLRAVRLQIQFSIRSERQLMNSSTTIFCSAGSSGSPSTSRCESQPCSPRTAIA
jgi:transposase